MIEPLDGDDKYIIQLGYESYRRILALRNALSQTTKDQSLANRAEMLPIGSDLQQQADDVLIAQEQLLEVAHQPMLILVAQHMPIPRGFFFTDDFPVALRKALDTYSAAVDQSLLVEIKQQPKWRVAFRFDWHVGPDIDIPIYENEIRMKRYFMHLFGWDTRLYGGIYSTVIDLEAGPRPQTGWFNLAIQVREVEDV